MKKKPKSQSKKSFTWSLRKTARNANGIMVTGCYCCFSSSACCYCIMPTRRTAAARA